MTLLASGMIVFAFWAGAGEFSKGLYGPFHTLDECNSARVVMIDKASFGWKVLECKKYKMIKQSTTELVPEEVK